MLKTRHGLMWMAASFLSLSWCGHLTAESWSFAPADDAFDPAAGFDLRSLNEHVAGETGFIKRSPDGNDFVLGNGKPAHFWAMNIGTGADKDDDLTHEARFLAKRGVNLVRIFLNLDPDMKLNPNAGVDEVNRAQIEKAWRTEAAMKKEGIYTLISPFWPTAKVAPSWNIPGHQSLWGVLFTDSTLQKGYHAWLKALFTEPNPHTGIPLAKDPAVAVIQVVNEDSLLFWTMVGFYNEKGEPYDQMRTKFATWAVKKHGSLAKALADWGNTAAPGDASDQNQLGFLQVWETTSNPGGPKGARVADQIEFITETQRDFYHATETYMREELGCKQLINASNWRPAEPVTQFDAERYSYSSNEVMAVNRYMSTTHLGPDGGWAIDVGDRYSNLSCTLSPTSLPLCAKQPVGFPFIITESSWVMPNLYQSEGPMMIAAYSALTGVSGYFWFTSGSRNWDDAVWPWGKCYKWNGSTPMEVGQFPAAALMFREGDITRGKVAVHEERGLSDIWTGKSPILAEEAGYDPNRDANLPASSSIKTTVNPMAFLVGRVEVVYGGNPAKSTVADLSHFIDAEKKTISSITGQEHIDYGRGLCTVDAPKAQGAAGFLGAVGAVALGDVTISCTNHYATILVVSMDGNPIHTSAKLLVQIGTTCRPTDWKDHAEDFVVDDKTGRKESGFVVDSFGKVPWSVENGEGSLVVRNALLTQATALDANGMPSGEEAKISVDQGAVQVQLPEHALYLILSQTTKSGASSTR
jgi:hypothetical protein